MSLMLAIAMLAPTSFGLVGKATALDGKGQVSVPLDFWAQDTDGDGLYNYLWVNVTLDVAVQDTFTFNLEVNDQTNVTPVTTSSNTTYLLPGTYIIPLLALGFAINVSGTNGPYNASVRIFNFIGQDVAWLSAESPTYLTTDFEEPPALVGVPFNDIGFDLDVPPDGFFNQLQVSVPVTSMELNTYLLVSILVSPMGPPISFNFMALGDIMGSATFNVSYSGLEINASGLDGPYIVMVMLAVIVDGNMVMISQNMSTTGPYLVSDFQSRVPLSISGTVTDPFGTPIPFANVNFINYMDIYQNNTSTNFAGQYTMDVYAGNFTALVTDPSTRNEDRVRNVTVSAPGDIFDFNLRTALPQTMNSNMVMTTPDSGTMSMDGRMNAGVQSFRHMVDWIFGNRDGSISSIEADLVEALMVSGVAMDDSDDMFFLDDIFFYPDDYENILFTFDILGNIWTNTPITIGQTAHMASNSTIPSQAYHLLRGNMTYDTRAEQSIVTIQLPPGWIAISYDPVTNVTVSGMGTGTVTIDPLGQPNPGLPPYYVWVNITIGDSALIPPMIVGQMATPDPQEWELPILLSAWVNDTSPIATVDVEIFSPTGILVGNFSMTYNATSVKYEYTLTSYAELGTYSYTIWAVDTDGNVGFGIGTFVAQDTTNPVADAGPELYIRNGTAATLDGTGSSDNYMLDNYTWTFDDGFGPVTLYGAVVVHVFNLEGDFLVTLTVRDTSGNPDSNMTIVHVLPPGPIVEGQRATPDPQEFATPVQPILIDAWVNSSFALTSVDVEIISPTSAVLGNFSMTLNAGKYEYSLAAYTELGTYTFTIWAQDSGGEWGWGIGTFVVQDTTNPTANAGLDQYVIDGTTVMFNGSASTDNYGIDNWTWTFTDGVSAITLYGEFNNHTFSGPGVYTVTLNVTDIVGLWDTDTMTVTVQWPPTPNPPSNVAASQTALNEVTITWTAPTSNTNGSAISGPLLYIVYRATAEAGPYIAVTPEISTVQHTDTVPSIGTYYYKVEAINGWGNVSEQSSPAASVTVTDRGSTSGNVVNGEGQALEGATVEIISGTTVVGTMTTGTSGTFQFTDLAPGSYTVRASKDGYESDETTVIINPFANTNAGVLVLTKKAPVDELPWLWIIILIIVIVIVISLVLFMMMRKKARKPETPPPPPEEPMEPQPPESVGEGQPPVQEEPPTPPQ